MGIVALIDRAYALAKECKMSDPERDELAVHATMRFCGEPPASPPPRNVAAALAVLCATFGLDD